APEPEAPPLVASVDPVTDDEDLLARRQHPDGEASQAATGDLVDPALGPEPADHRVGDRLHPLTSSARSKIDPKSIQDKARIDLAEKTHSSVQGRAGRI